MTNKESKFYTQWWFWVIIAVCVLGILSAFNTKNCNCPATYEVEYKECSLVAERLSNGWNDYVIALYNYCVLDTTNPICIASQDVFDRYI